MSNPIGSAAGRTREVQRRAYLAAEQAAAFRSAYAGWRGRRPWHWLPLRLRAWLFPRVARRYAEEHACRWITAYRREHREEVRRILGPDAPIVILPPAMVREQEEYDAMTRRCMPARPGRAVTGE